jgi:hypothetical protein
MIILKYFHINLYLIYSNLYIFVLVKILILFSNLFFFVFCFTISKLQQGHSSGVMLSDND